MAEDDLKSFLRQQARSLDSLLELTPAKNMFGEDVSDQWKRKKQTPEQKRAAKIAKLNPANWKSAKDVYDERSEAAAKKRKRDEEEQRPPSSRTIKDEIVQDANAELKPSKKRKVDEVSRNSSGTSNYDKPRNSSSDQLDNPNARKRAKKRANRTEKKRLKEQRKEQAKPLTTSTSQDQPDSATDQGKKDKSISKPRKVLTEEGNRQEPSNIRQKQNPPPASAVRATSRRHPTTPSSGSNEAKENVSEDEIGDVSSSAPSTSDVSDILSPPQQSASSSVSSIPPNILEGLENAIPNSSSMPKEFSKSKAKSEASVPSQISMLSEQDRNAARERLQQQISGFRSLRKADVKPIRSRAELLEQRREEEQKRKAAKKEQRRKEKEEEARRQDEEMAKRFSPGGSGSLLGSPRSPMIDYGDNGGFTFGRIAFGDGTHLDNSTMAVAESKKHKGPSDPASALKAANSKAARLSGLDDQKRKDIDEKDMWLNAKRRAHGERTKDDTSLLKKALKRQEKEKGRSEKDWTTRIEGVRSAQEAKQKRRTENLQKRKDEKFAKKTGKNSKVKRPGFEGSFRSRTSSKKK